MTVKLIGLRDYAKKDGSLSKKEVYFRGAEASSVLELFQNLDHYLSFVPVDERYNVYYTASSILEGKGRVFESQEIIPFDIDGIDIDRLSEYLPVVVEALKCDPERISIVYTGNGIHVIIMTDDPFHYDDYFNETRALYKALCGDINVALKIAGLTGQADSSVWSGARLLRCPNTKNIKPNKTEKNAIFLVNKLAPQEYALEVKAGVPFMEVGDDYMSHTMFKRLHPPDPKSVIEGCDFLKWCRDNQNEVSEPQWYGMISILAHLPDGRELCHDFSKDHEDYNPDMTNHKVEQALAFSGPRTCHNISTLWDGCPACPNFAKCKSPIQLRGEQYLQTKDTGFYYVSLNDSGVEKKIPAYGDLCSHFEHTHPYITHEEGRMIFLWNEGVWSDASKVYIDAFAESNFKPAPTNGMVSEFAGKLTRRNLRNNLWFSSIENLINFKNGVLDLKTRELLPHSPDYPFRYKLPFDYDPDATCPRFDLYLQEVTKGDSELVQLLLEYMAYALAGLPSEIGQKALILTGDGANGKSVLLDLLKHMAGYGNYSTLYMGSEINKMENRYQLDGKLFNISEEVPEKALVDSSIFKSLVTGGEVQARKLYCDAYSMKTNAKIIMACNELPATSDLSHGIFRRLLIVPFNAKFTRTNMDVNLRHKLYAEASGIFNRVLIALDQFLARGEFQQSVAVDRAIDSYKEDNDDVLQFFCDELMPSKGQRIPLMDVYRRYRNYCEDRGMQRGKSLNIFSKRLRRSVGDDSISRVNHSGKKATCLINFAFIDNDGGIGGDDF